MSREDINICPLFKYDGPIHLVRAPEELEEILPELERERVLGFDTETRPSFFKGKNHNPSLVQLAGERAVFLIQLGHLPFNSPICAPLIKILGNRKIIKTGVAVREDIRLLKRLCDFEEAGIVDLGEEAKRNGLKSQGLRNLVANFLGLRISKSAQCSNWANRELSQQQIAYAATDAWASRAVYLRMEELNLIAGPAAIPEKESG